MNALKISTIIFVLTHSAANCVTNQFGSASHTPLDIEGICLMTGISSFISGFASNLYSIDQSVDQYVGNNAIGIASAATTLTLLRRIGLRRQTPEHNIINEMTVSNKLKSHQADIALVCYGAGTACALYTKAILNSFGASTNQYDLSSSCMCLPK